MQWYEKMDRLADDGLFPQTFTRMLLTGPPGTGKSAWAFHRWGRAVQRITFHQQLPTEDVIGCRDLRSREGGTETVWTDGPAVRAMEEGLPLVIDEIDQFSPEIRCMTHAMLDDPDIACLLLPDGRTVRPKEGYCVIATTNQPPSVLHRAAPALLDRFEVILTCDKPHPGIMRQMNKAFREIMVRHYEVVGKQLEKWTPEPSARRMMALDRMLKAGVWSPQESCEVMYPGAGSDLLTAAGVSGDSGGSF